MRFLFVVAAVALATAAWAQRTRIVIEWKDTALTNSLTDLWQTTTFQRNKTAYELNPMWQPLFNTRQPLPLAAVWGPSLALACGRHSRTSWLLALSLMEIVTVLHNSSHFGYGIALLRGRF